MAKAFAQIGFDPNACRREIDELGSLLRTHASLSERRDIQPFFKKRPHLAAFIGSYVPLIGPAVDYAFEYQLYGDFSIDLIVGRKSAGRFCVIEFEDGRPDSVFRKAGAKATLEWSPRFEHGFSQIVDWFHRLDDFKNTADFRRDFGHRRVRFSALLVVGRDAGLTPDDLDRLDWRSEKVRVDSHSIECLTFDALHQYLDRQLRVTTGH